MYARVITFTGTTDIDAGVAIVRDSATPVLQQQKGYRGVTASADRSGKVFGILSLWETAADREASDSALSKIRDEAGNVVGGKMTVELFEETLFELIERPAVGSALVLRRVSMDPAKIEENRAFFTETVLPQIKSDPGILAIRQLLNRDTGEAIVATVWKDEAAARAGIERAQERQSQAAGRVSFGEQQIRELLYADMP